MYLCIFSHHGRHQIFDGFDPTHSHAIRVSAPRHAVSSAISSAFRVAAARSRHAGSALLCAPSASFQFPAERLPPVSCPPSSGHGDKGTRRALHSSAIPRAANSPPAGMSSVRSLVQVRHSRAERDPNPLPSSHGHANQGHGLVHTTIVIPSPSPQRPQAPRVVSCRVVSCQLASSDTSRRGL
ncbi:hypothetical protein BC567DRAFT_235164 [Phyllosticta citribraziliensis]